MKLSIVMSVHNKAHYMEFFVSLLKRNTPGAEFILIDDGSTDGTGEILKRHADVFIRTEDIWEVKANNVGLRAATGDYVAIIQDDDLVLADGWFPQCVAFMQANNIHILGGRSIGHFYFPYAKDGTIDLNPQKLKVGDFDLYLRRLHMWSFPDLNIGRMNVSPTAIPLPPHQQRAPVFLVEGTYRSPYIIARETIDRIGYLDEIYSPLGYDDHDYCARAWLAGLQTAVTAIPMMPRFQGGSNWLYGDNLAEDIFSDSFDKNYEIFFPRYRDQWPPLEQRVTRLVGEITFAINTTV